ncbi:hypothetical protein HYV89_00045 [Candidatus Woesearchaeota archaeon]|nr:hypothetical protein [Candidatus Woesearchaeota archaeon]
MGIGYSICFAANIKNLRGNMTTLKNSLRGVLYFSVGSMALNDLMK